jgi:hypothetical protein
MAIQNETLERAFRAIDALLGTPTGGENRAEADQTIELASKESASPRVMFPHCPRCALYRPNNIGNYECLTCELRNIEEDVARKVQ